MDLVLSAPNWRGKPPREPYAASILVTSLTRSRRWIGLDSTLACLGAVESALSATAAKPVMNMILISGSSSAARRASSIPSISGITPITYRLQSERAEIVSGDPHPLHRYAAIV